MFPPLAPFFLALHVNARLASRPAKPGSGHYGTLTVTVTRASFPR